jgi:plasmid stabilization system protein ParE
MSRVLVQEAAAQRIDELYRYGVRYWGTARADTYLNGLFQAFDKIAENSLYSRPIPAEFGVTGFFFRYQKHRIYWKKLASGDIGIVTVLHERMHQIERFKADFNL